VEISWHERGVLLQELMWAPGARGVRRKFADVGATRSVELEYRDRVDLCKALDDWGSDSLQPDGIARLHTALGTTASSVSVGA
jgi:hypothetical protein